jgi:hypothetical protein
MTEAEARQLLRDWPGVGGLEAWIAGRRWRTAPGGWIVTGELQGWQFRLDVIPAGLRVSASAPGGRVAVTSSPPRHWWRTELKDQRRSLFG